MPGTHGYNQLAGGQPSGQDNQVKEQEVVVRQETGCMGRCCACLAAVPCSALMCWLMLTVAVSACGGSLMVASRRTAALLNTQLLYEHADFVCLGVLFGMVFIGLILLIAATFTSRPLNADSLASSKRTNCLLAWLVIEMLILLLFLLAWTGVSVLLTYPLSIFFMVYIRYYNGADCIDLRTYLVPGVEDTYCGPVLHNFYDESIPTFEVYTIALVGSVLVVFSIVFHLMYVASNYIQIRESTTTNYDIYKNEVANKHPVGSVLDTRM